MKKLILLMALVGLSGMAQATEYGKVVSVTPVMGDVSTPQRTCWDEQVRVEQPRTGAGSLIGAVAGGLLGSTVGRGDGRSAATAVGVITGAVVGDSIEGNSGSSTQTVRRCGTSTTTQRQVIGYDVVYEYAGKQYSTRMASDPGERVPVSVTPVGAATTPATTTVAATTTYVVDDTPTVVYRPAPATVYVDAPLILGRWGWDWGPGPRDHGRFRH